MPCVAVYSSDAFFFGKCVTGNFSQVQCVNSVAAINGIVMREICAGGVVCVVLPQIRASCTNGGAFIEVIFTADV